MTALEIARAHLSAAESAFAQHRTAYCEGKVHALAALVADLERVTAS